MLAGGLGAELIWAPFCYPRLPTSTTSDGALLPETPLILLTHTLNNLALLCDVQGQIEEVIAVLEASLKMKVESFGRLHPMAAMGIETLAVLHEQVGDDRLAEARRLEALELRYEAEHRE